MRSKQEIEQDISLASMQAGDLQYKIAAYTQQLGRMNDQLGALHQEMIDLVQAPMTSTAESLNGPMSQYTEATHGEG